MGTILGRSRLCFCQTMTTITVQGIKTCIQVRAWGNKQEQYKVLLQTPKAKLERRLTKRECRHSRRNPIRRLSLGLLDFSKTSTNLLLGLRWWNSARHQDTKLSNIQRVSVTINFLSFVPDTYEGEEATKSQDPRDAVLAEIDRWWISGRLLVCKAEDDRSKHSNLNDVILVSQKSIEATKFTTRTTN